AVFVKLSSSRNSLNPASVVRLHVTMLKRMLDTSYTVGYKAHRRFQTSEDRGGRAHEQGRVNRQSCEIRKNFQSAGEQRTEFRYRRCRFDTEEGKQGHARRLRNFFRQLAQGTDRS